LTGLQFGDVGAAAHVIRALLADGDAAKVDGGARIGMSVADGPKVCRDAVDARLFGNKRRTNARAWYTISGVARTFPPLK